MKIRNGFVSNSSSSSFIIAGDDSLKAAANLISAFVPISEMGSTKEELENYIKDYWGIDPEDDEEEFQEKYKLYQSFIERNMTIYSLEIDYNLENFDKDKLFEIGFELVESMD